MTTLVISWTETLHAEEKASWPSLQAQMWLKYYVTTKWIVCDLWPQCWPGLHWQLPASFINKVCNAEAQKLMLFRLCTYGGHYLRYENQPMLLSLYLRDVSICSYVMNMDKKIGWEQAWHTRTQEKREPRQISAMSWCHHHGIWPHCSACHGWQMTISVMECSQAGSI